MKIGVIGAKVESGSNLGRAGCGEDGKLKVHEFVEVQRVAFCETDLAGVVHFGSFFRYMENTEHSFFRSLGFSIDGEIDGHHLGWPRVHASCDYRGSLRFEDLVEVRLLIKRLSNKTIEYLFPMRKVNDDSQPLVAVGRLVVVCTQRGDKQRPFRAVALPPALLARIEAAPEARWRDLTPDR